ncbi:hypothetical protein CDCA_CDCA04G1272 [Cyanidium caldarium]|uniref:Uncharacterized protein n=1 Tax=Cyanidium caldarium TaxID=2771 RepID=A0AAV9ISF6_CYACA|nr:hypothetical protein CDCA_CDCA04G1272 [Cyanidium caldarium]
MSWPANAGGTTPTWPGNRPEEEGRGGVRMPPGTYAAAPPPPWTTGVSGDGGGFAGVPPNGAEASGPQGMPQGRGAGDSRAAYPNPFGAAGTAYDTRSPTPAYPPPGDTTSMESWAKAGAAYGQQYLSNVFAGNASERLPSFVSALARNAFGASSSSDTPSSSSTPWVAGADPAYATRGNGTAASGGDPATFFRVPKYYFQVDVQYVLRKLQILLFPFRHRHWSRRHKGADAYSVSVDADAVPRYLPPCEDANAPDLYIPVMAFVTYVLIVGFVRGTQGEFTPEIMGRRVTVGLVAVGAEVLLLRMALFVISARGIPWMDIVALSGYKFVGLVIAMLTAMLAAHVPRVGVRVYLPVLLYVSSMMGLFLLRTYKRMLTPEAPPHEAAWNGARSRATDPHLAKRNYLLLLIALIQIPLYLVLSVKPVARNVLQAVKA